jgi:murein DD-endopeptidase MepM/ murein hydrolase activator NlpD
LGGIPLESVLQQASSVVNRLLGRLSRIGGSPSKKAAAGDVTDPISRLREAALGFARGAGGQRLVPIGLCALLVAAAVISSLPEVPAATVTASAQASAQAASVAGAVAAAPDPQFGQGDGPLAADYNDIYLGDGSIPNTLENPGTGIDAKTLLRTYTVVAGDTLSQIAGRFGLAPSTIYWANKAQMPDPASLHIGQALLIPPMDGLLVKVGTKDTLASLATKYKVLAQDIIDANNLPDTILTLGETLLIPGASGGAMPAPKTTTTGGGRTVSAGSWIWPVDGYNYISQYFWSGHHAIDIASTIGTPVVAAVGGTVVFSGWKYAGSNGYGGGLVIWVMNGAKLYTTYNHLSYAGVRVGQKVRAGQVIGRIGMTGNATGPHLHFEVWLGYPWGLGTTADAVNPCRYLAGC